MTKINSLLNFVKFSFRRTPAFDMNFKSVVDPLLSSKLTLISVDYVSVNSLGIKFVFKEEKINRNDGN